jgi:hypothetical protein
MKSGLNLSLKETQLLRDEAVGDLAFAVGQVIYVVTCDDAVRMSDRIA